MGARSTDALVRLLAIRDWLATNAYFEPVPLDDVVRQFGGTRDKMLRDLNTLSVADDDTFDFDGRFWVDIDLLHDSGLVQLMSHIDANQLPGLTPSEALAIRIGLESLSSVLSRDLVERIPAVLDKIGQLVGERGDEQILLHHRDHQCQNAFALLDRAIGLRRPVVFTYTSANGATQRREVEPRELHLEGTGWMLLGWCMIHDEWRTFAVDRMSDLEINMSRKNARRKSPNRLRDNQQPLETQQLVVGPNGRWVADEYPQVISRQVNDKLTELLIPIWSRQWFLTLLIDISECLLSAPQDSLVQAGEVARQMKASWDEVLDSVETL